MAYSTSRPHLFDHGPNLIFFEDIHAINLGIPGKGHICNSITTKNKLAISWEVTCPNQIITNHMGYFISSAWD